MASRRCDGLIAPLLAAAIASPGMAQDAPVCFTAPDGSRFVLVVEPAMPHVHWAVATWADGRDDPPGLEGLSRAVIRASRSGTWQTGSRDPVRERQALERLDEVWQQHAAGAPDAPGVLEVQKCAEQALEFADVLAFTRVLATLPADRPEIVERDGALVLVLTTLPAAIGDVGRLLVERREDQALRELPRCWQAALDARAHSEACVPPTALHTEVLAMALPERTEARVPATAATSAPRYAQALAVWAATQRPERTVHVLLGGFDAEVAKAALNATFVATALPPHAPTPSAPARPLAGMRRSVVPGVSPPALAVAWVLPADVDRAVLAAATTWLAGGPDSRLGQELQRSGRTAEVQCRAPWPATGGGGQLLLIEVTDRTTGDRTTGDGTSGNRGSDGLLERVLRTCRTAAATAPDPASVQPVVDALQRQWRELGRDPRARAAALAADALASPQRAPAPAGKRVDAAALQALLAQTFAGEPVAVEGKP